MCWTSFTLGGLAVLTIQLMLWLMGAPEVFYAVFGVTPFLGIPIGIYLGRRYNRISSVALESQSKETKGGL